MIIDMRNRAPRKKATVHEDVFDAGDLEAKISEYDARRESVRPYSRQRNPERFGEAARYGWSEEKFRQYSDIQRSDFGSFIRGRGFNLD